MRKLVVTLRGISRYTREQVIASYNGLVDVFIECYSRYMIKVITGDMPGENDLVDLHHLTYLRNSRDCFVVSDDKIFDRFCKERRIRTSEFIDTTSTQ